MLIKIKMSTVWVVLTATLLSVAVARNTLEFENGAGVEIPPPKSKEAYVTLLYGEDFVLGVRVLGQSIRETNTNRDIVLIATGAISKSTLETFRGDGWRVMMVETINNPAKGPQKTGFPARFYGVYTKLSIFNLVEYEKVVYLDADTIMTQNSDELFSCPGFCATLRHSERLNSGVMVVTPSTELYEDMVSKITTLPSYTGGDQGFLNAYFKDFMNAPVFDASNTPNKDIQMMRLPTSYNADIGLYVLNSNKWMIPEDDLHIIHFTMGPIKPWHWWSSWIIKEVSKWEGLRNRLPIDSQGYPEGSSNAQRFSKTWLSILPAIFSIFLIKKYLWKECTASLFNTPTPPPATGSPNSGGPAVSARQIVPKRFTGLSIFVGYFTLLVPLAIVFWVVPNQIAPVWGWGLSYEWLFLGHFVLFGLYLHMCYRWGRKTALVAPPSHKNAYGGRPWKATLKATLSGMLWMLISPWIADVLFIQSFITKVIVTSIGAVVVNVILTHVYASLPIRWFACGRSEAHAKSTDLL